MQMQRIINEILDFLYYFISVYYIGVVIAFVIRSIVLKTYKKNLLDEIVFVLVSPFLLIWSHIHRHRCSVCGRYIDKSKENPYRPSILLGSNVKIDYCSTCYSMDLVGIQEIKDFLIGSELRDDNSNVYNPKYNKSINICDLYIKYLMAVATDYNYKIFKNMSNDEYYKSISKIKNMAKDLSDSTVKTMLKYSNGSLKEAYYLVYIGMNRDLFSL